MPHSPLRSSLPGETLAPSAAVPSAAKGWLASLAKRFARAGRQPIMKTMTVRNQTRQTILGHRIGVASSASQRRRGLLQRDSLEKGEGLWIVPCEAVHTFAMHFPIDLVYLDRRRCVRKIRSHVVPRRLSGCLTAHSVLELPSGTILDSGTRPGDVLDFDLA
jgi:uncharacterized protein